MSSGNWGDIPTRRTRGSRRRRIVLSVLSVVVLVLLVMLSRQFFGGRSGMVDGIVLLMGLLLVAGVLWDLRPWRGD
jgi:hypothetical protein